MDILYKSLIFMFIITIFLGSIITKAAYRPEISGDLEIGEKIYTDLIAEEENEEVLDEYNYQKYWFKYKQRLTTDEYYYLKAQYYEKNYEEQLNYNNITLNLWGNYTYRLNDKMRNRWRFNIKDKDYGNDRVKSYKSLRLKYQLDYQYNSIHDYTVYFQRQWNDFINDNSNNNIRDKLSFNWDYSVNEDLDIDTTLQFEQQRYNSSSESSNKYGKKLSVGFKYKL